MTGEAWLAVGTVAAAAITALGAYIAARRGSRRMADLEARKLDGAEYDRNQQTMQAIIENLRAEVDRLEEQVAELRGELRAKVDENHSLRDLVRQLTETANGLHHQIRLLERELGR